ncbi:MAG: sodium:solute symporter family transporter [Candidatus Binatia bacterium]
MIATSIRGIDVAVLCAYLALMAGIGAYFTRYIRAGTDFLKGGNRIEWWVAGMASFMSGFSVWTFTGGAGFAYRNGVIGVFLLLLASPAFVIGYFVFATRWRRARVTTVVEYVRSRFGDLTHKVFSWMTVPSQLVFGGVRLFALSSFMSIALGVPVPHLVVGCGLVILLYTTLGGYWAVCFTDMFQFMFLFPIACLLAILSLESVGGFEGFAARAPAGFFDPFAGEYGWLFLLAYTVSQTVGYNNFANAQRYFCADTERSARKIALLCTGLFTLGSFVFYLPPLVARIVLPELATTPNGLEEPTEAAYVAMGMKLLPGGLAGVLLAAMLASSMASLSATNHIVTGIVARDLYQGYLRPDASDAHMLRVSRRASVFVGLAMIGLALLFAGGATSVFTLLFVFESIFLIPLGLPLLFGLLSARGPWWSALFAYVVGASTALVVAFATGKAEGSEKWMIAIPAVATTAAFFAPALLVRARDAFAQRVAAFFALLATPVDPERELGKTQLSGREQLAIVGRVTTGMGLACFAIMASAPTPRERWITGLYALTTTLLGAAFVVAGRARPTAAPAATSISATTR